MPLTKQHHLSEKAVSFVPANGKFLFVVFTLLYFIPFKILAQYIPLDIKSYKIGMESLLKANTSDSTKARVYFELSYYSTNKDSTKAKEYLNKASQFSKNNSFLRAINYYYLGNYFHRQNKALAKQMYFKADSLLSKFNNPEAYKYRFWSWYGYSKIVNEEDNDVERLNIIVNKALPMAQKSRDRGLEGICYGTMAIVFNNSVRVQKAEEYFLKSIDLLKKSPYKWFLVDMYSRAARNYMVQVNRAAEDSLEMKPVKERLPLAKNMLDSARGYLANFITSTAAIEYYKYNAKYLRLLKQFSKANKNLDSAMVLARTNNLAYDLEILQLHKYQIFSDQKKYKKAKAIILSLLKNPSGIYYRENKHIYYYELSLTYARLGDYKNAYHWTVEADKLEGTLNLAREREAMDKMDLKYKTAEHEKKIIRLESEKKQALLTGKNNRLTSWLLGAGCILFICIAGYSRLLYHKNKKISKQQLKEIQQQQEIKEAQAMLQLQEEERSRMARDLHDGVGSMLAGIKINLSGIAAEVDQPYIHCINDTMRQLDNSVAELRRIAHNLVPDILLRYGLEVALQELAEILISPKTSIDLQCLNIQPDIAIGVQLSIYRIIQELLSNAVKHADANSILVQCSQNEHIFMIAVEDDGKGFDTADPGIYRGIGISNIKNRVAYLNGSISYSRGKDQTGTIVNIELYVTA